MKKLLPIFIFLLILTFVTSYLPKFLPARAQITQSFCTPPSTAGEEWVISSPCVLYENTNGPRNANIRLQSGTSLTLHSGKTLVWYPGKSITIQPGASIIVNTGSQITQKRLCVNAYQTTAANKIVLGPGQSVIVGHASNLPSTSSLTLTYTTSGGGVTIERNFDYNGQTQYGQSYTVTNSSSLVTSTFGGGANSCGDYGPIGGLDVTLKNTHATNTIIINSATVSMGESPNSCGANITKSTWSGYYSYALTATDPITGQSNLYMGADQIASDTCSGGRIDATNITDTDVVVLGTPTGAEFFAESYRYLLNLGMAVSGINNGAKIVQAAGNLIQVLGDNLAICDGTPCPALTFPDTGGSLYVQDRVGIGTTTPGTVLDVNTGTSNLDLQVSGDKVSLGDALSANKLPYIEWRETQGGTRAMYLGWGNTVAGSKYVNMALENTYALNISGGNVGIGTNTPATNLHVFGGNIRHEYSSTNNAQYGFLESIDQLHLLENAYYDGTWKSIEGGHTAIALQTYASGSEAFRVSADTTVTAANETLTFSPLFTVQTGGNVGIGTTSPSYKLHVAGEILSSYGTTQGAIYFGDGFVGIYRPTGTSNLTLQTANNFQINSSGGSNYMTILSSGNVGIGTTNPTHTLQVAGRIHADITGGNANLNSTTYEVAGTNIAGQTLYAYGSMCVGNASADCSTASSGTIFNNSTNYVTGATTFASTISTKGSSTFAQSDNTNTAYNYAPIQIREAMYGATSGYLPPRLSFHWGGVVASQIAMDSGGAIQILNNPGTGYEKLKTGTLYSSGANIGTTSLGGDQALNVFGNIHVYNSSGTGLGYVYSDGSNFGLLNNAGNWILSAPNNTQNVTFSGSSTITGDETVNGGNITLNNAAQYSLNMSGSGQTGILLNTTALSGNLGGELNFARSGGIRWVLSMRGDDDIEMWRCTNPPTCSSWTQSMSFDYANGNVGIGVAQPSKKLDIGGELRFYPNWWHNGTAYVGTNSISISGIKTANGPYMELALGGGYGAYGVTIYASSQNMKKNITDLEIDTSKLYQLKPKSFNWKVDPDTSPKSFGYIAEEAIKILPDLVITNGDNKPVNINYPLMSVLLLEETKKHQESIKGLEQKISDQQKEIDELKKAIQEIKNQL